MAKAAPDGIDVFFDNVGCEHLEAAIGALRLHARIVLCGMVCQYNEEKAVGPRNLWNLSVTRSAILAFMVGEELDSSRTSSARSAAGSPRAGSAIAKPCGTAWRTPWTPSSP
ncbi:hypothetical protein [Streptomyces deccanensis]|uniref:hypothetical protein n=1 Tax=Streptomyces deccanensis TaxID=424188 RepID=UPI001EFB4548|nr:hypothetical protein [Streptomyces deccanensis]ULR48427.1 hypothetical protein L3078_03530 [Streptomyces deccanensis]